MRFVIYVPFVANSLGDNDVGCWLLGVWPASVRDGASIFSLSSFSIDTKSVMSYITQRNE
jgi:hypothetical protein